MLNCHWRHPSQEISRCHRFFWNTADSGCWSLSLHPANWEKSATAGSQHRSIRSPRVSHLTGSTVISILTKRNKWSCPQFYHPNHPRNLLNLLKSWKIWRQSSIRPPTSLRHRGAWCELPAGTGRWRASRPQPWSMGPGFWKTWNVKSPNLYIYIYTYLYIYIYTYLYIYIYVYILYIWHIHDWHRFKLTI